jgi:AmmeMemoRadiSam system protein A
MLSADKDTVPAERLTSDERGRLLEVAERSIRHGLAHGREWSPSTTDYPPALRAPRASFVTLERHGRLRGCIGSLTARRPLVEDVAANAFAAAFRDPRFEPLAGAELAGLDIHVSVLSATQPIDVRDRDELKSRLRPDIDGLVLAMDGRSATFLPQVWESLPDPEDFVAELERKAGLKPGTWTARGSAERYTVESFGEAEVRRRQRRPAFS